MTQYTCILDQSKKGPLRRKIEVGFTHWNVENITLQNPLILTVKSLNLPKFQTKKIDKTSRERS